MLFPFGILVYHLHHPPQLGVGGSWHCPVGAAHGAALFPLPSWRGTWRGPLGAAHGMALLAWLMAWPSWRGSWCSPVGAACWRSPHGTATRARPPWRSSPHGTALMARPSCWACRALWQGGTGGPQVLLACRWALSPAPRPPPALCARRGYTPIHRVRHWTVGPQSPCHLAGPRPPSTHGALIGRRACVGSSNKPR